METIDKQFTEIAKHAESKCRKIYRAPLPFSEPVHFWDRRKKCYADLIRRLGGKCTNESNIIKRAWAAGIEQPRELSLRQLQDGVRYCKARLHNMKQPEQPEHNKHVNKLAQLNNLSSW